MPLARIRSFDPEAIAFLAAQLAQSGYTLQFVRPDETALEPADLELTVVRRDLDEALRTAQAEAERLGVDVTVLPGVVPVAAPDAATAVLEPAMEPVDIPAPAQFPSVVEMPARVEIPAASLQEAEGTLTAARTNVIEMAKVSSAKTAHALSRGLGKAVGGFETLTGSIGRGLAGGKENLLEFGDSTANRLKDWKLRIVTARALRREARPLVTLEADTMKPKRAVGSKPFPLLVWIYKGAAVAAVLAAAAIVGWTLAGYVDPANPPAKPTGPSPTAQERAPLGPTNASTATAPLAPVRIAEKTTSKPKAAVASRTPRTAASEDDDFGPEVVVRHFGQKPVAEQAKFKTRDGVKVISEE